MITGHAGARSGDADMRSEVADTITRLADPRTEHSDTRSESLWMKAGQDGVISRRGGSSGAGLAHQTEKTPGNWGGGFGRAATKPARAERAVGFMTSAHSSPSLARRSARHDGSQREPFHLLRRPPWHVGREQLPKAISDSSPVDPLRRNSRMAARFLEISSGSELNPSTRDSVAERRAARPMFFQSFRSLCILAMSMSFNSLAGLWPDCFNLV